MSQEVRRFGEGGIRMQASARKTAKTKTAYTAGVPHRFGDKTADARGTVEDFFAFETLRFETEKGDVFVKRSSRDEEVFQV